MVQNDGHTGSPFLEFLNPIGKSAERCNYEMRSEVVILLTEECNQGYSLDCLSQAHLICQNPTHALLADLVHPCKTFELVVSHFPASHDLRLLGHFEIMLTEHFAIESAAHSAKDLSLLRQNVGKGLATRISIITGSK